MKTMLKLAAVAAVALTAAPAIAAPVGVTGTPPTATARIIRPLTLTARRRAPVGCAVVIYCVVPEPLADELLPKLTDYYADDPNVTVIVDRRRSARRDQASSGGGKRELRDRRRRTIPGELPSMASSDLPEG